MTRFHESPPTTVVTGGGGWLGNSLLRLLAREGEGTGAGVLRAVVHGAHEVLPIARLSPRIEVVVADICRPRTLTQVFSDLAPGSFDVIHTAGVIHPPDVETFDRVNRQGTINLLEAAENHGVRRFVHVSSNSPFGTNAVPSDHFRRDEPYHPYLGYGWSKMEAEVAVIDARDRDVDTVIVRPPWFYGPNQPARQTTFFTMIRTGRFPIIGDGTQRRSMVFVEHLVDGVRRAQLVRDPANREWWIADREPYTLDHIVETVSEALRGEGYDVAERPLRVPSVVGRLAEAADRALQATGRYNSQVHVLGEMDKTIAVDISAAQEDLGYEPWVPLLDGMRRSIRWCREQGIEL